MSHVLITRRSLLAGSAGTAALLVLPRRSWAAEPVRGGRLIVAADSEPSNLNPAIVASNGVAHDSVIERLRPLLAEFGRARV